MEVAPCCFARHFQILHVLLILFQRTLQILILTLRNKHSNEPAGPRMNQPQQRTNPQLVELLLVLFDLLCVFYLLLLLFDVLFLCSRPLCVVFLHRNRVSWRSRTCMGIGSKMWYYQPHLQELIEAD